MSQRRIINSVFFLLIFTLSNVKAQDINSSCDYIYLNNASLGEHYMKTYMGDSIPYSSYDFVFFYLNDRPWKPTEKILFLVKGDTLTEVINTKSKKYLIDKKLSFSDFSNLPVKLDTLWRCNTFNSFIFETNNSSNSYLSFYFWNKKRNISYDILVIQNKIDSFSKYTSCIKEKFCKEEIEKSYNKFLELKKYPFIPLSEFGFR